MRASTRYFNIGVLFVWLIGVGMLAPAAPADEGTAASSGVSGPLSKLSVHGFLTQAYATADFAKGQFPAPHPDEILLGIPEDGTTAYRNLALQFRYEMTPKDIFVVQFSSRALGDSVIEEVEDEIELDWAFYERRLADHTSLKVGRVKVPLGIFNEYRDVGTILPFYRPAYSFYREGSITSETVDGLDLSHTFNPGSDWSLELDVYFGEYELIEFAPFLSEQQAVLAKAKDVIGAQLWLNTPIYGLRFGAGRPGISRVDRKASFALREANSRLTTTIFPSTMPAVDSSAEPSGVNSIALPMISSLASRLLSITFRQVSTSPRSSDFSAKPSSPRSTTTRKTSFDLSESLRPRTSIPTTHKPTACP